jgi:serine/threonine protein kinase
MRLPVDFKSCVKMYQTIEEKNLEKLIDIGFLHESNINKDEQNEKLISFLELNINSTIRTIKSPDDSFEKRILINFEQNNGKHTQYIIRKINTEIGKENLLKAVKQTILLKRIKTGNLIQGITDYCIINKILYIKMKYIDNETVLNEIKLKNINNDETVIIRYLKDVAFALDFLHMHNQSHNKIKLDNMFVNNENRLILGEIGFEIDSNEIFGFQNDIQKLGNVFRQILDTITCNINANEELINLTNKMLDPESQIDTRFILKKLMEIDQSIKQIMKACR